MRKILITILLLASIGIIYAQTTGNKYHPSVMAPSPITQNFQQYINHPVTEYNGLPTIEIPLYEISIKGLKIPVTLTYHAAGVKFEQKDGDVGVGWSISAGGYRMSRTIAGVPDEMRPFVEFQNTSTNHENAFLASVYPSNNWAVQNILQMYSQSNATLYDAEYDKFYYNLPSTNGSFIINNRNNMAITILNGQQDKVTINPTLDAIAITDDSGFHYTIGVDESNNKLSEKITTQNGFGIVPSSWPLTKITSPYDETVKFSYTLNPTIITEPLKYILNVIEPETKSTGNLIDEGCSSNINYIANNYFNIFYVDKIQTGNESIEFTRNAANFITSIVVKDNRGIYVKQISFNYATIGSHTMLNSVTIVGRNASDREIFQMQYYNPTLSAGQQLGSDQWGYHKAYYTSSSTPSPKFIHQNFASDQFLYGTSYSTTLDNLFRGYGDIYFVDKVNNPTAPVHFALRKIIYPSGGETEYVYESHKFRVNNADVYGGGLRIKEINSRTAPNEDAVRDVYKYGENETGYVSIDFVHPISSGLDGYLGAFKRNNSFKRLIMRPGTSIVESIGTVRTTSYYEKPLLGDYDAISFAQYDKVTKYTYKSTQPTERVVTSYKVSSNMTLANAHGIGEMFVSSYALGANNSRIIKRQVYNNHGQIVNEVNYAYELLSSGVLNSCKVLINNEYESSQISIHNINNFATSNEFLMPFPYTISKGEYVLTSKSTTDYDSNGLNPKTVTESYGYDNIHRLISTTHTINGNDAVATSLSYPSTESGLINKHMLSTMVKKQVSRAGNNIGCEVSNYGVSSIVPLSIRTSATDANSLRDMIFFSKYDAKGNIQEYKTIDGMSTVILWSYNSKYPIAEIKNATYEQVYSHLGSWIDNISNTAYPERSAFVPKLESLRGSLPESSISIYVHEPLMGVREMIDPSGVVTKYEYVNQGRLSKIRNGQDKVVEEYQYNLINK